MVNVNSNTLFFLTSYGHLQYTYFYWAGHDMNQINVSSQFNVYELWVKNAEYVNFYVHTVHIE